MQKLNLHARQKKILSILNAKHGVATGKEISNKIGVSERTIRTDISEMNEALKDYGISIVPKHGKGYTLSIADRGAFLELFSEKESYVTKEDRLTTLLLRLLREEGWSDLGILEDEMFVSHTTLEKDIKAIKKRVSEHHPYLALERKGSQIRFEDNEWKKRDLFTRFYAENWDYDSKEGIVFSRDEFGGKMIKEVQTALKEQLLSSAVHLDDYAFIYLTLAIDVMLYRVGISHAIKTEQLPNGATSIDADIQVVLDQLKQSTGLDIPEAEYINLSEIKEQLVFLSEKTYSKNYVLEKTDTFCHHVVDEVLEELFDKFGIDFLEDDKLFVDLTRHVQAIMNGIVAPSLQNHVLGDELRKKYPFLGDIAHALRLMICDKCGAELGIEEEDYLLPFIILAEENLYKKRRGKGIPTAIISHYDESMTQYLMENLRRRYGDVFDLRGPYSIYEKEIINTKEVMLILTTVQISSFDRIFQVPVLTVSPLLEIKDQMGIDLYLTSLKSSYLYKTPAQQMVHYFPAELTLRMDGKNNLLPALDSVQSLLKQYVCNCAKEEAGTNGKLANADVTLFLPKMNLEEDYFCNLMNGFLFCYHVCDEIPKTTVSLVDFGKEISCKYVRNIKTVMYMVIPSSELATLGWFYYIAMALSSHPEELRAVFDGKSLEDLSINISRGIKRDLRKP